MITTVFKDKLPSGVGYPFSLGFLRTHLTVTETRPTALYFVHSSLWVLGKHNMPEERMRMPVALLSVLWFAPTFRNNNQKISPQAGACDLHFLVRGAPSRRRKWFQERFANTCAAPLSSWIIAKEPFVAMAHVFWDPKSDGVGVAFQPQRIP
jgi:hypothetical protein